MFTPLYSSLTLPTSTQVNLLPSQFPVGWRRASMFCVGAALLIGAVTTLSWRLDLAKIGNAINAHDSQGAMVASWGTGQQSEFCQISLLFISLIRDQRLTS
ncbi:BZ3500_MvSof-1268-A1-R1_Chr1-3g02237 [Microbotryum saponariae]|uniref:BZ3500_MvSof-1268-A1-R1_Chr1-3g02237 protein n=1 Tax=Microbotryum saponariae TaxID=289078 RepID=A0A2X0MFR5_9BASI|nr:BZ3500_MvSof-1268-A1-R1_Chr1-3g02237 [Microbotryum saponariae]SCZ95739.1 BZ3501_MvSof-1269-A2-R1_Chr1-3g01840 [Microbotryum saponariae]